MPTLIEAPRRKFYDPRPFLATKPGESVYRNVPNFEAAEPVPTISVKTPRRKHIRRYLRRHEPILVRSEFLEQSVPVQRWSDPGYLKHKAGDSVVTITQGLVLDGPPDTEMTFAAYLDALAAHHRNDRQIYMRLKRVPTELGEDSYDLVKRLQQLSFNRKPVFGKRDLKWRVRKPCTTAFIGRHTYTDSHEHGGFEAFLVQVAGTKEVLLHPPTDNNYRALYVGSRKNWSPVRFFNPDLEEYPLFQGNKPVYTQVRAGELLYIPDGWFHSVASQDDGVNVTLTYFFPPTHFDLSAAPTWSAFKRVRRDGTLKERSFLYARMIADPTMLRSFVKRHADFIRLPFERRAAES